MNPRKRKFLKRSLKAADFLISITADFFLVLCAGFAGYSLWDNNQVYVQAENVQAELFSLKPKGEYPSFDELRRINPDVCAWLTLGRTKIDLPVVQGKSNIEYVNKDVFGNFSLAGSIFLDGGKSRAFSDLYNLLYGHHMDRSRMFGDLDLYKIEDFFHKNHTGTLMVPGQSYDLEIFAVLDTECREPWIFEVQTVKPAMDQFFDFAESHAVLLRKNVLDQIRADKDPRVLSMTTCSSESESARTAVLAWMKPRPTGKQEGAE